jgi:hypothetical protein
MWNHNGLQQSVETIEPYRNGGRPLETAVRHLLRKRVDAAENPWKDLERKSVLNLHLQPEAAPAEVREREMTEVLR